MPLPAGIHFSGHPDPANVRRIDMGAMRLVDDMHYWGIKVDVGALNTLSKELAEKMEEKEDQLRDILGPKDMIDPGSRNQVAELLFRKLRVQGARGEVRRTKGGAMESTDADQLNLYRDRHPSIPVMLDWREYSTIKSTFADALPRQVDEHSRIHTELSGTKARTGRYASSNPNLQNIPTRTEEGRKVRAAFVAEEGWTLCASDLSQIEMRVMAHASGDPVMVEGYRDPTWDVHTQTAMDITGLPRERIDPVKHRSPAKPVGFGVIYLIGPEGLQSAVLEAAGVLWDQTECAAVIDRYYKSHPAIRKWQMLQFRRAKQYGMVWDMFGRIRLIPQRKSRLRWIREEGMRQAANQPIQSGATGIIKISMLNCYDKLQYVNRHETLVRPLLQIHDELIWEVRNDYIEEWREAHKPIMEEAVELQVPVKSSFAVSDNWAGLK